MKFYKRNDNDPLYAFYKKDSLFYPVFAEKYGNDPLKADDAYEITDEETILALNKYMQPYESGKPKVYMAGPLFNEGDRYSNQLNSDALRNKGFTTFLPQEVVITNKSSELVKGACFYMDLKAIYECDYIVANCNGIEIDSGTAAEIGMGYALNKKMYLYKSDVRNYYNERFKLNNFVSGLVDNRIYATIEEIIKEMEK
ncbi:MAG: nucleoside 2-deoxyribosyltransferase [Erysipelotrichaceae bacterium]|jgi:nucleoside 2-deoxyribosyltransferase